MKKRPLFDENALTVFKKPKNQRVHGNFETFWAPELTPFYSDSLENLNLGLKSPSSRAATFR